MHKLLSRPRLRQIGTAPDLLRSGTRTRKIRIAIGKLLMGYVGLPKLFTVFAVSCKQRFGVYVLMNARPPFQTPGFCASLVSIPSAGGAMPKRVLIADDSPSVRKLVLVLFKSNGFSICGEAENGAQAIEKARQTRPDIIVLDYSMPVMDGIRAAKSLKQLMPRVPLLLFTVHDSWVLEKEALAAGVAAIVSKEKASDLIIKARTLLSARNRLKRMFSLRIWW